jgi:hypothetical protein
MPAKGAPPQNIWNVCNNAVRLGAQGGPKLAAPIAIDYNRNNFNSLSAILYPIV